MRKIVLICLCLVSTVCVAQQRRHFTFRYSFEVSNVRPGQRLEVWFPLPKSDDFQQVKVLSAGGDLPLEKTRDAKYGNAMFHAVVALATKQEYRFAVEYDVVREERAGLAQTSRLVRASQKEMRQALAPDKLVPVTGKLAGIAGKQVQGRSTTLQQARALFDYVFAHMRYDKSGTGWGRGDAEWACDSHRGNCTDFHSMFISMARSQKIPARFEIGFPLPLDKTSGEIPGYHCWADFYDAEHGWVPVDISEAWQDQAKKDYFFGTLDVNRVQFSVGRDIVLSPKQAGEPLNYFVYPYVEVGGKAWGDVANDFSFRDVSASAAAATSAR